MMLRRVLAEMGDEARARICDSSGSEHSPADADLSKLVNSFIERDNGVHGGGDEIAGGLSPESETCGGSHSEAAERLRRLLGGDGGDVKQRIRRETEIAWREVEKGPSSPDLKRRVMARLRDAGFDAGLCKSRWEKTGRVPAGSHDFVDVKVGAERYIVETLLAGEFTIARPASGYAALIEEIPGVFVGEAAELKEVVGVMCGAMRASMKSTGMHLPPWRRDAYMQSKWFGGYRRTTNVAAAVKGRPSEGRRVGFHVVAGGFSQCRDVRDVRGGGVRLGHLSTVLNGSGSGSGQPRVLS